MHVSRSGPRAGAPLLLLHGGGVAGWMWDPVRGRLQDEHTVLVPDLPGHGRSSSDDYRSHAETVSALADVLRTEVPGRAATVVGFSLGAQLAIGLASAHPELLRGAVAISAQAKRMPFSGTTLGLLSATAPLARRRWFARLQARELFVPPALMEEYISTSAGITRATLLAAVDENIRFQLPTAWTHFPGRALVMAGSRERPLMRESAVAISAALPGSELEIIDGCGHGIPLQRPDWLAGRILSWLGEE